MIARVGSLLIRGIILTGVFLVLAPVQLIALACDLESLRGRIPVLFHRMVLTLLGVQIAVHGVPARGKRVLYLSNHCSYLDIPILGSLLEASFISKAEVAGWPILGWLSSMQRTIFINRQAIRQVREQRDHIAQRVAAGDSLILFPEGTSSDGNRVLPFKSSLLSVTATQATASKTIIIQPISLAYSRLDGMPMGRALRPAFAWYGAMGLIQHITRMLFHGMLSVDVVFHPAIPAAQFSSRKDMAAQCHTIIAHGVAGALYGRLPHIRNPFAPLPS